MFINFSAFQRYDQSNQPWQSTAFSANQFCHPPLMTTNQPAYNYQCWSLDRLFHAWVRLGILWPLLRYLRRKLFQKGPQELYTITTNGFGLWEHACVSQYEMCKRETGMRREQMRLRDEKRDHLFQPQLITLPPSR